MSCGSDGGGGKGRKGCQPRPEPWLPSRSHLDGVALADLAVLLEDERVVVAVLERRERHDCGNRAEVEDALVAEKRQVVERVGRMAEGVDDHGVEDPEALLGVLGLDDVGQLLERKHARLGAELVRGEDRARPEATAGVDILLDVAQDVGLLEKETHRVGEDELLGQERPLLLGRDKQARETLADETGDVAGRRRSVRRSKAADDRSARGTYWQ